MTEYWRRTSAESVETWRENSSRRNQPGGYPPPPKKKWADDVQPSGPTRPAQPRRYNQRQQDRKDGKYKKQASPRPVREISDAAETTPQAIKAKTERLVDEPLWQEGPICGTHPVVNDADFNLSAAREHLSA